MVEDRGAGPRPFNLLAGGGHAAARLAGDNDRAHAERGKIDVLLGRDLAQMRGVGRRAAEHVHRVVADRPQTGEAAESAAGQAATAHLAGRLERRPKAEERPEGEGEVQGVGRRDFGGGKNLLPIVEHPLPALRRVEPTQRRSAGGAGLREAVVGGQRKGKICAVRRMGLLVGGDLFLPREGHVAEEVVQRADLARQARFLEAGGVKSIAGGQRLQERAELWQLVRGDRLAAGKTTRTHA